MTLQVSAGIQKRNSAIDLLKMISIFGVLVIHISSSGYSDFPIQSFNWYATAFWSALIRFAVPVFFMCSGALMLDPKKEITPKALYTKYLPRILIALFFWAAAYEAYHLFQLYRAGGALPPGSIWASFKNLLLFRHHFHLYYLHIIILVYAFLPMTRILIRHASKEQLMYAIAIWFFLGIVLPFAANFYPFTLLSKILARYSINTTYAAIGYGIMGYYLKKYPPRHAYRFGLLFLLGFCIVFCGTVLGSSLRGSLVTNFLEGMSPGVAFLAIGLFGVVTALFSNKPAGKPVMKLSAASFCIYLVHDFFNLIFRDLHVDISILPSALSIPMLAVINLLLSFLVYLVLSRIPVVKTYLV